MWHKSSISAEPAVSPNPLGYELEFPTTKPSSRRVTCCHLPLWDPACQALLPGWWKDPPASDKSQPLLQMMWLIDTCLIISFELFQSPWTEKLPERSYCGNPFCLLETQEPATQLYFSFPASNVHRNDHSLIPSHWVCFKSCWNTFFSGGN